MEYFHFWKMMRRKQANKKIMISHKKPIQETQNENIPCKTTLFSTGAVEFT